MARFGAKSKKKKLCLCAESLFSNFRLSDLVQIHEKERNDLVKRSVKQRKKMDKAQGEIEHYLDDVVIALNQRHVALEIENKTEYAVVKEEVRNKVPTYLL